MIEGLIYDVGMNHGDDTAHYLACGYRVVGIEANPILAAQCRSRFAKAITSGRLVLLDYGVGNRDATLDFWVNERTDEWSSFLKEFGCRDGTPCHSTPVRVRPFAAVLREYGVPYYLKIDIEGNDLYCLQALDRSDLPVYVSVEAHELQYLSILHGLGYNRFKVVDQVTHNARYVPTIRERIWRKLGRSIPDPYPLGSSGPFGEDTVGEWQDLETVAYVWLHFKRGVHEEGMLPADHWYDFHATRSG